MPVKRVDPHGEVISDIGVCKDAGARLP